MGRILEGSLRKLIACCATVAALITTNAFAADLSRKAPNAALAPSDPWTGFYVGAAGGYGWGSGSTAVVPNAIEAGFGAGDPAFGPLPSAPSFNGGVAGGEVGFNRRFGSLVAGLEADLSWSDLHGSSTATGVPFIGGTFQTTLDRKLDWFGTVRGRLGLLPTNDLLLYATGGFAYGGAKTTLTGTNFVAPCSTGPINCYSGSTSGVSAGWAAGAGLEFAFAPGWSVKAEYLHLDLGDRSVTAFDPASGGGAVTATAATRADLVRAGFSYLFR
jgi:outer membrane immunogenic protein